MTGEMPLYPVCRTENNLYDGKEGGETMQKDKTLESNGIKLIAIFAMTADHIAWTVFPGYPKEPLPVILHILGRLALPDHVLFYRGRIPSHKKFG